MSNIYKANPYDLYNTSNSDDATNSDTDMYENLLDRYKHSVASSDPNANGEDRVIVHEDDSDGEAEFSDWKADKTQRSRQNSINSLAKLYDNKKEACVIFNIAWYRHTYTRIHTHTNTHIHTQHTPRQALHFALQMRPFMRSACGDVLY